MSLFAKVFGWAQFILQGIGQISSGGIHGWQGILTAIASLAAAIGIHAASNTAGPVAK